MIRLRLLVVCLVLCGSSSNVLAQHRRHHGWNQDNSWLWPGTGFWSTPFYPTTYTVTGPPQIAVSGGRHPSSYRVHPTIYVSNPAVFFPPPVIQPVVVPTVSVYPVVHQPMINLPANDDVIKLPPKPSTPAMRLKSMEHQASGDEKLRKHLWAQAYMSYRSAIDAAGDRGEARFRQGFTYTAMQHFSSAVREFKRGLSLEKDLPVAGIKLATLFGPDSEITRTSILHKVADWVRENPNDSDRWFLLGVMLHYEDDSRSREVLKVAHRLADGNTDHIVALLSAPKPLVVGDRPPLLPELPPMPAMPDQLPAAANQGLPAGLPPLLDRPTPPGVPNRT